MKLRKIMAVLMAASVAAHLQDVEEVLLQVLPIVLQTVLLLIPEKYTKSVFASS